MATMMFCVQGAEKVGGSFVLGVLLSAAPMHEPTVVNLRNNPITRIVYDLVQRGPQCLAALPFRRAVIARGRIRQKPQSARHREDQEQELSLEFE